jgi:hypothetical protein
LIATLAMIAFAQAQSKSSPVTSLEEGEAIYVGKNGTVHKIEYESERREA